MNGPDEALLGAIDEDAKREDGAFDETSLDALRALADKREELLRERDRLAIELKEIERDIREIEEETLVSVMDELGMESFGLEEGLTFEVDEAIHMSIPKKNVDRCAAWLSNHGHEDLVSRDVVLSFSVGEGKKIAGLLESLNATPFGNHYEIRRAMHTGRVKALFRELLDDGQEVPLKLFGGYLRRYVKIKTK